jgi:MoxR-like ATPase
MTFHHKFSEITTLVNANIAVLLTGEKGSGKTTLAEQVSEHLDLKFYNLSMTRQTTLSHLLGFMSVNGTYIPSLLRECFENGGLYLLDELDAGDPNVLLALNTIENGYISFPTGLIRAHPDFRLIATANPQDQHEAYTGRAKLDAATMDRFDEIEIDRDVNLERTLVDPDTFRKMAMIRETLGETNSSIVVSMRDSMRYQVRKDLGILEGYLYQMVDKSDLVYDAYKLKLEAMPKHGNQSECQTFDELMELVNAQSGVKPKAPSSYDPADPYGTTSND